jgi:predicted  nucleic acid-binding Zn-ribbon protein
MAGQIQGLNKEVTDLKKELADCKAHKQSGGGGEEDSDCEERIEKLERQWRDERNKLTDRVKDLERDVKKLKK